MAKIVHSDGAPNEAVHYSLAGYEFDLGGDADAYDTTDSLVIANAQVHPWLRVEFEPEEVIGGEVLQTLAPEDDVLSRVNSIANDPDAIREVELAKGRMLLNRTAIDAGLDQNEVVEIQAGPLTIAETLAADVDEDLARFNNEGGAPAREE